MTNIQVKNVPPDVHSALRDRAASRHQSLQEYILQSLVELARTPTASEVLDLHWARVDELQIEGPSASREQILASIDEGRAGR